MEYICYYDESFSDRKITGKNGRINFLSNNNQDLFVSFFYVLPMSKEEVYKQNFLEWEVHTKSLLGLGLNDELKGESISRKRQFKFGIASFHRNTISIYTNYFEMINKNKSFFSINVYSKMEFLISSLIIPTSIPREVNYRVFLYSLTKFISNNFSNELFASIFQPKYNTQFKRELIKLLKTVRKNLHLSEKNQRQINMIDDMLYSIRNLRTRKIEELPWDYSIQVKALMQLLDELNLETHNTIVHPDKGSGLVPVLSDFEFKEVSELDSVESSGVRGCDIMVNFVSRIMKSMRESIPTTAIDKIDIEHSAEFLNIEPDWFTLNKQQFNLFKEISKFLFKRNEVFWSSFSGIYSDYLMLFFDYIHYVGCEFTDFEEFSAISSSEHINLYMYKYNQSFHRLFD